jgi:chromosome segregation ATPase
MEFNPIKQLEETNQQLREEVSRKDAEIAELKQQSQTKEVIMRQIIETLRINFAMEIEKKDKDCKQQLQEFKDTHEKDEELLKTREKQLELNNCRMVNLNQRIVNLTKQTEERETLCHRIMYEKDEDFEDLKNEVHEYYEETKRQNEAIEYLKITNQEIGRLNYLLILGTSEKKINDFSPEF